MVDDDDDDNNTLNGKIRFICSSEHVLPSLEELLLAVPYAYNFTQLNWLFQ
jgi:hypothetical protein